MIRRPPRGLTVAEIVLSLALLLLVMVSVIGLFTKLLASTTKTTDLTAGTIFAQRVMERAVRAGPPGWGGSGVTALGQTDVYTHDIDNQTTFLYRVIPAVMYSPPELPLRMGTLYNIDVLVYWWVDDPDRARAGMGRLSFMTSQTVYVRN